MEPMTQQLSYIKKLKEIQENTQDDRKIAHKM